MKIATVIISYQSSEVLKRAISSVLNQTVKCDEIYVVDNGSTDGYSEMIKRFPQVKSTKLERNYGTMALNIGIMQAYQSGCDYIFLDDSDVFLDSDVFEKLIKVMERNPKIGIAGPMSYEFDYARTFKISGYTASISISSKVFEPSQTDYIGASMVRMETIKAIGGVQPEYFAYYNDADLCVRARAKGFLVYIVPEAKFHHLGGYTTKKIAGLRGFTAIRNRCIFVKRNYSPNKRLVFLFWIPLLIVRSILRSSGKIKEMPEVQSGSSGREMAGGLLGAISGLCYLIFNSEPQILKKAAMHLMRFKLVLS